MKRKVDAPPGFRLRGTNVSRLECFSDAVFGFALTLIVVSLEVPKSFDSMVAALKNFPAFAFCFIALFQVWSSHNLFFRRTGLDDAVVRGLTATLLFVVLAYVYPLKFLAGIIVNGVLFGSSATNLPTISGAHEVRLLFGLYGTGGALVAALVGLLYAHAYRVRASMELTPAEAFEVKAWAIAYFARIIVPMLSIAMAWALPDRIVGLAGYVYFLIGVSETIIGWQTRVARTKRLA